MRFAPDPEQLDFAAALGALLAGAGTTAAARAWADGDPAPGRAVWARLAGQGLLALALPDAHGGIGATSVDLVLAFEQLGRFAVPGPYVESVAVLPTLLDGTADAGVLDRLGDGTCVATVAVPPHVPFALDAAAADAVYLLADGVLHRAVAGDAIGSVAGDAIGSVAGDAIGSVDAARRLMVVTPGEPVGEVAAPVAARAFDLGAVATAAQLQGLGAALLERSVDYAKQRSQFGAVIGSFQAVKHHLADVAVGLELSRPLLFAAALALDHAAPHTAPHTARDVSAARVACADAAYRAARVALQVHGAVGYTAEYDLALWLTKVRALVSAWGTQRAHRDRVRAALAGAVA